MIIKFLLSYIIYLLIIAVVEIQTLDPNLKGFDDSILFKINWPGKDGVGNEIFVSTCQIFVVANIYMLVKRERLFLIAGCT